MYLLSQCIIMVMAEEKLVFLQLVENFVSQSLYDNIML